MFRHWSRRLKFIVIVALFFKIIIFKFKPQTFQNLAKLSRNAVDEQNIESTEDCWKTYGFNECSSNKISVWRKTPDHRSEFCKNVKHGNRKNLPSTSIIITFNNEAWSTLLRSVHSVIDHSPENLIKEIILIDDFSDMGKFKF